MYRTRHKPSTLAKARFEAHTSGMNSAMHQITVVFACRKCGAIYQASQRRCTDRHFGVYNCLACRTQVYAWHGAYDFLDWKVGFLVGGAVAKSGAASALVAQRLEIDQGPYDGGASASAISAWIEDQKFRRLRRVSNVGLLTAHDDAQQFGVAHLLNA